jgi:hypothetical protein
MATDGRRVKVDVTSMTTDFGRLHIVALPLSVNFSNQTSLAGILSGHLELTPNVMVSATAMLPYLSIDGKALDTRWFRFDVRASFLRRVVVEEAEQVTLSYNRMSNTYSFGRVQVRETTTSTEYVTVPAYNLNGQGINAGLMGRTGAAKAKFDRDFEETTYGKYLTAYLGIAALNAMGLSVNVDGYGGFKNYRWLTGGADILFDVVRSYDRTPSESRTRFGARLWTETIFARQFGLAGRLEIGYLPSGGGVYILAGFGGGLNLGLGL